MIELTPAHLRLPEVMAWKYGRRSARLREEMAGAGTLALVRAAAGYRAEPGSCPDGYLHLCVERACWSALRAMRRPKRRIRPASLSRPPEQGRAYADVLPDRRLRRPDEIAAEREEAAALLAPLSPREAEMVALRADGWKLREVADRFGLSAERVRQVLAAAARKVREARGA